MRHNVYGKHLGRNKNQRTALFRGLIRALVLEGSIVTTEAKAKAVKGLVDKLFAKAKKGDNASQNVIIKNIPQKEVVKKILEIAKTMKDRNSGFTQTVRMGTRSGDNAMMIKMSIISDGQSISKSAKSENVEEVKKEKLAAEKPTSRKTDKPKAKKVSKK